MKNLLSCSLFVLLISPGMLSAQTDWPQWLGPAGTGISSEAMPDITSLKIAWQKEIGVGYAGIATADGRAYTMGHDGKANETLFCFSLADGKKIWKQSYPGKLMPKLHKGGPNATPLIADQRIFTVSKDGQIQCRDTKEGKLVWQSSLPSILKVKVPSWGFAGSPQIVNGQLLLGNGKTVALNPEDGEVIWISDTEGGASYATAKAFSVGGKYYAAVMTAKGTSVISLADGKTIASYNMTARFNMIAVTPLLFPGSEGEFFASTSFEAARLKFDGKSLKPLWTTTKMRNKLSNSVLIDGHLYGIDGGQGSRRTQIVCMNAKTGKPTWIEKETGHGTIAAGKGGLCFLSDDGELVRFAANSNEFQESGRRKLLDKICWTVPTLSQGHLLVRNDQGKLICLAP